MYEYFRSFYRAALDRAANEREAARAALTQAGARTPPG
jgi:hypothetical protein